MSGSTVWLDVKGAAAHVLVSPATIQREAKAGRLKAYRVGGRKLLRIKAVDLDIWLERSHTPQPYEVPLGGRTTVRKLVQGAERVCPMPVGP